MDDIKQLQLSARRNVVNLTTAPVSLQSVDITEGSIWKSVAKATQNLSDHLDAQKKEEDTLRLSQLENDIDLKTIRLRDQYAHDPDGFTKAYDEMSSEIIKNTEGEYHGILNVALGKKYNSAYESVLNEKRTQTRSLAKQNTDDRLKIISEQVKAMARNGQANTPEFQNLVASADGILNTQANLGFINSDQADLQFEELSRAAKAEAILGSLDKMYDQSGPEKTQEFLNNYLKDPENKLGQDEIEMIGRRGEGIIAEKTKAIQTGIDQLASNIKLNIDMTEDPSKLSDISDTITREVSPIDPIKANDLRTKIFNKFEAQRKEAENVAKGSLFASGAAYLNPQDKDSVKAFNTYYEKEVASKFGSMDPIEKNTRITNILRNAAVLPDLLKGDFEAAGKSLSPDVVANAADMLNRIEAVNPYLLKDINEKDKARIHMVDDLINSGYVPEDAYTRVDEMLSPSNEAVITERSDFLKKQVKDEKINYQNLARSNFSSVLGYFGKTVFNTPTNPNFKDNTPITGGASASLTADYRRAYEDHYKLTGDKKLAKKHADGVVKGMYGVSQINGFNQLMKYAPEKYFQIENSDNKWLRTQMMDAIKDKAMLIDPSTDLNKSTILVPDPYVTPRTASEGRPEYKIMLKTKDGTLVDMLEPGEYFTFDPNAEKQRIVDEAKKKSDNQTSAKNKSYDLIGP